RWPRDWSSDVCSSDLVPTERERVLDRLRAVETVERGAVVAAPGRLGQLDELALELPDPSHEEATRRVELALGLEPRRGLLQLVEIGRASCRARGDGAV